MPLPSSTTVALDAWLPFVLPNVAGCPDATALHHIRQACIEFCERTLLWREWLPSIASQDDVSEYTIQLPAGASVAKVLRFEREEEGRAVATDDYGRDMVLNDRECDVSWSDDRVTLYISPAPGAEAETFRLRVALKPSQAATTVPAVVFEQFARQISDGALAGLHDMEGVLWAGQGKAMAKRAEFEMHMARAAAQTGKSFSRGQRKVRPFHF